MLEGPQTLQKAVLELAKLPGVGVRTAQRLALFLLTRDDSQVQSLANALLALKEKLRECPECFGITDEVPCMICGDPRRDSEILCVVENPSDVFAVERSSQFRGKYHVLHGSLAPLEGRGPDQIRARELLMRVDRVRPREILLATNPNVEGDATALYLARKLADRGISTTRLAMGIPLGGSLEYADQITLGKAILERRQFGA